LPNHHPTAFKGKQLLRKLLINQRTKKIQCS